MPERDPLPRHLTRARTTMGVSGDGSAWVHHRAADGTRTDYRCAPRAKKVEYLPADYDVTVETGPDVLDHGEVRACAHDAFIDAYGAL